MAVKYADEIIVLSKGVQKYFKDTYNRDTTFIPNGVNKPEIREADIITKKYGLKKDDYILFLARIVPEKGLHYLIDAFKEINTDKKLVIAGGASHTNNYLEEIKRKASQDSRIIMTSFVQGQELEELFSNCYLYCLPSDIEGMPISLLEAMSYGCNCLVSDIEENVQVCENYATAFQKGNSKDLKVKLEECLQKKEDYNKEQISDFILKKYNWDEVLKNTEKLYNKQKGNKKVKILLVNKFLYPKGGAETYVIKLGEFLKEKGHEVQYFGLQNKNNTLTNNLNLYVKDLDFQKKSLKTLLSFVRIIHCHEAQRKIFKLLKYFKPDMIILNNIEYHLTPSIILSIGKYKKNINKNAKLFYVAHDYQLICPSHGLFDINIEPCEKCLKGNYWNCYKTKCLKNSKIKSLIGTIDSWYWHKRNVYKHIDNIICPSNFMKRKLDTHEELKNKTVAIHNFVDEKNKIDNILTEKKDYIIYFGKLCKDKGVETLLKVAKMLPEIEFVFAGYGPLENEISSVKNAKYVGFKKGIELQNLISSARLSICPSEWYENCPFSVIEAQMYGTPVLGSNMGGIPELISIGQTGEVFEAKNVEDLKNKILMLWNDKEKLNQYSENCLKKECETLETYMKKIFEIYEK